MMSKYHNPTLSVEAPFEKDRVQGGPPMPSINKTIDIEHTSKILNEILDVQKYYSEKNAIEGVVVTIHYNDITPKSSRVQKLFSNEKPSYLTTIGARFSEFGHDEEFTNHVISYYVTKIELSKTIDLLTTCLNILTTKYSGSFTPKMLEKGNKEEQKVLFKDENISMSAFHWVMQDLSKIDKVSVLFPKEIANANEILVTLFPVVETRAEYEYILKKLNVPGSIKFIDNWNAILKKEQYDKLLIEAPYLICMNNDDFTSFDTEESSKNTCYQRDIPDPKESPIIGVFDTMYEKGSYLDKYVTFDNLLPDVYLEYPDNMIHGTKVDSILVEGHKLNPQYDDECGYFRVHHFGVGGKTKIDFVTLYNALEDKVRKYRSTIRVWNISLGDERAINPYYVSLLGSKIDELSRKYNVLFIVAGTNISSRYKEEVVGSPADSFNAIVVNSVIDIDNPVPPKYSRRGPVLSFFQKPDIAYYGGDSEHPLFCYSPNGDYSCWGTSFAAPFIARKAAFLIYKAHYSPECAKALIIDSAYKWKREYKGVEAQYVGYGIPPISIKDIVGSRKDEIKMVISGRTLEQNTMVNDIPLLLDNKKMFNYAAKLTFCYFTYGSRNEGVDYSDQEISVKFGLVSRVLNNRDKKYHYVVNSINKDKQGNPDGNTRERNAMQRFGKWSNTKILIEGPNQQKKPKDYGLTATPLWGISVTHLDRFGTISKDDWINNGEQLSVKFGIVATFKTTDGSESEFTEYVRRLRANPQYRVRVVDFDVENEMFIKEDIDVTFDS